MKNFKVDVLTIAKVGSFVVSIAGLALNAWIGKKEQTATLQKMVDKHFQENK